MATWAESFFAGVDIFFAWLSTSLKQTTGSYCDLETADSPTVLVNHDGSLLTIIKIDGVTGLIGVPEFTSLVSGVTRAFHGSMSQKGHAWQIFFTQDKQNIAQVIEKIYAPAKMTAERIPLDLSDLFQERVNFLSQYCADESVYFALWTRPFILPDDQLKQAQKDKVKQFRAEKVPAFKNSQAIYAALPQLRDMHGAYVKSVLNELETVHLVAQELEVHEALRVVRMSADPDFTAPEWSPSLPGDRLMVRDVDGFEGDVSDLLWPPLSQQVIPRDAQEIDRRTVLVGNKLYSSVYIDLFSKEIRSFMQLFARTLASQIPWRISFLIESDAVSTLRLKGLLSSILSFASPQNRLISDSVNLLDYLSLNTDEVIVRIRVVASTWAPENDLPLLRRRSSELVKAMQTWSATDVSEICGDPYAGFVAGMLAATLNSPSVATVAPLSQLVPLLPITRPASPWRTGALLFRTPDGKPWPYQPGSSEQTTWIDLVYARPGSGKSVLSSAQNLALCLSAGLTRLPRISIIDIGPSSSGLISLLTESLPPSQRYLVGYYRLRMTSDYTINPFDSQLGCRYPMASERAFLVNFLTLLATPIGALKPYDGMPDLVGMVIDEMYKSFSDMNKPTPYSPGINELIDGIIEEIGFVKDSNSTWWEVTDALFVAGFTHESLLAQRYAMPLLADAASICRTASIEDLYDKVIAPTGESLINAFSRMISSAVREYPILSGVTAFDIGDARVVSFDLDEVAKSGGDAANRQTAVMYMLARYVLARHYYLTADDFEHIAEQYKPHHMKRVAEIREDPKRIVYDEFHRTAHSTAVREQVVIDMREGRKWDVQIQLISQALDDFDSLMIDFATSIYIMDAGPVHSIEQTAKTFGLSETATIALKTRVHGPREGGATFLAQFSTKAGINVQLLTLTLGPIELWAFSTTTEDVVVRNLLYRQLGPVHARQFLATLYPTGSVSKEIENRLNVIQTEGGVIQEEVKMGVIEQLVTDLLNTYAVNPQSKTLLVNHVRDRVTM